MIELRASSVGRFLACQASMTTPRIKLFTSSGPSELGSAGHELNEAIVHGHDYDVRHVAQITDTDPEQLAKLVGWCRWRWTKGDPENGIVPLSAFFPLPQTEQSFEHVNVDDGLTLTGRVDVCDVVEYENDIEGRVTDWKLGFLDLRHHAQMKTYAFLLLRAYPQMARVRVWVPKPRHRATDIEVYERDTIDEWYARLVEKVHAEESFNPSVDACRFCQRNHECPGKTALLAQAAQVVDEWKSGGAYGNLPTDPEEKGQVLARVEIATKFLENYVGVIRDVIKSEIEANGGTLGPLSLEEQPRTSIDPGAGLPVLQRLLGNDVLDSCVRIAKGDVERAVKDTAGRGMKGKVWAACLEELETAGALVPGSVTMVKIDTDKLRAADVPAPLVIEMAAV